MCLIRKHKEKHKLKRNTKKKIESELLVSLNEKLKKIKANMVILDAQITKTQQKINDCNHSAITQVI